MKGYRLTLTHVRALKFFLFLLIVFAFIHIMKSKVQVNMSEKSLASDHTVVDFVMKNSFVPVSLKKNDWHDYKLIKTELKSKGIGEQGSAAHLPKKDDILQRNVMRVYGFNGALSDKISLNRSLPDTRHLKCKDKLYRESLPSVSVIIPFHNEHPKTLLRTVYSVINRSPAALIKEVILVDDASTRSDLLNIKHNITNSSPKVKLVQEKEHKGLIRAKLIGATEATADVLVFLESHSEVNVNWLPPLVEPITMNYQTVVCPVIDMIDYYTFQYISENECHRGGFNWKFDYCRLPLLEKDKDSIPEPYENPVMMGGFFAISRIFFWKLRGYDPGLYNRGGDQYELSFKIWQCGGRILTAPCSRVGHVNRSAIFLRYANGDFITKNYRRVAEVWMDEFAQYVYKRNSAYLKIDAGDLTEQKELRTKLQCKPFKWFMSQVAFDILLQYPPIEPPALAKGYIKTLEQISEQSYCIQACYKTQTVFLNYCYASKKLVQEFSLTWHKEIRTNMSNLCWDLPDLNLKKQVILHKCHGSGGSQQWWYDVETKNIVHGSNDCLDWDILSRAVFVNPCNDASKTQQWEIEYVNGGLIKLWDDYPNAILDIWNSSLHYDY